MIILGVDPGTAIVGIGVIEYKDKKIKTLYYGCIYTEKDMHMNERLNKIYNELQKIIEMYKPDVMAIEELFYFKNNKTVISVSQARGVILLAGIKNNLEIWECTPLQVKMGITGYGRAEKKQVQLMVQKILGLLEIPKPDDAADALAIGIVYVNSSNSLLSNIRTKKIDTKLIKNDNKITAKDYRALFDK